MYIIYKAKNIINGKLYIGQTCRSLARRKLEHETCRSNSLIHKAIKKYGKDNFEWKVLENCSDLEEANLKEEFYIKEMKTHYSQGGYNILFGGDNRKGFKHSEDTKEKIRQANIGLNLGGTLSEDHKRKLSEAKKGKTRKGTPMSEETKEKLRQANKGFKHTKEVREKIVKNLKPNKKRVICLDTGEIFESAYHAYFWVSGKHQRSKINDVCLGKRETAYGYKWAYYEEETSE